MQAVYTPTNLWTTQTRSRSAVSCDDFAKAFNSRHDPSIFWAAAWITISRVTRTGSTNRRYVSVRRNGKFHDIWFLPLQGEKAPAEPREGAATTRDLRNRRQQILALYGRRISRVQNETSPGLWDGSGGLRRQEGTELPSLWRDGGAPFRLDDGLSFLPHKRLKRDGFNGKGAGGLGLSVMHTLFARKTQR